MKTAPTLLSLFLFVVAGAMPQDSAPQSKGAIYGVLVDENNQPAKGIGVTVAPSGLGLGGRLPGVITDQNGHYRIGNLSGWGKYTVYPEDWGAGYSIFVNSEFHEATISPEHPEAELNFRLPPRAGFLDFHLTNRKTGKQIGDLEVKMLLAADPPVFLSATSQPSTTPVLVVPDKGLLIHVTANGFKEWDRSAGNGLPILVKSGDHLKLDVQLEPAT